MTSVASKVWSLFATPLLPAHYLALVAPGMAPGQARIEAVRDEAPGVFTLVLRPGRGFRAHRAGQHVRVGIAIDGRITTRTYSISSAPGDRKVEITVKAQGRVSNALVAAPVGTFVALGQPEGDFTFPEHVPALLVTAGSGITPIASMVRTHALRDVVHVHYTRGEMIFGEELLVLALDNPGYRLIINPARFGAAMLDRLVPDWRSRACLACGPERLLEPVAALLPDARVERFRARLATPPAQTHGGLVQFGKTIVPADGDTPLLHVAERAGLTPRAGCRMGICHTCDVTMVSGCVRDLRTNACIDEPGARIQLCVCAAAGDVELSL